MFKYDYNQLDHNPGNLKQSMSLDLGKPTVAENVIIFLRGDHIQRTFRLLTIG